MASKTSSIKVNITGDARDALKAINQTTGEMMTMQQKTGTAISGMASAVASAGVVSKITDMGKAAASAAGDLQQSIGGVETVFGDSASKMLEWSDKASQAVGLSKNEYNEFATLVGSQLQNMGMSVDESANKTNDLIGLGADLSSMFGGTTADAVDALSAALKGEMDPIEKYGITLNDSTLKAKAAEMGLGDLYKAGDRNAKMQATLAAITAQSGKAVGNFAKEGDTAQGQLQRMNSSFTDAKAALGLALLPYITQAAAKLAELGKWVQQNTSWLTPLAIAIGVAAGAILAINAAMSAYAAVTAAVAVAQGALNVAFLPIIAVILAVIAVVVLLATNWDTVKTVAGQCVDWITEKWTAFTSWIAGVWDGIKQWASDMWNGIAQWCSDSVTAISDKWNAFKSWVGGIWDGIKQRASDTWNGIKDTCKNVVDNIVGFFTGLKDRVAGIFDGIRDAIKNALSWVGDLWDKITGASNAASSINTTSTAAYMPATAAYQPIALMSAMSNGPMPALAAAPRYAAVSRLADIAGGSTRPRGREERATINITINASNNIDNTATAKAIVDSINNYMTRTRGRNVL